MDMKDIHLSGRYYVCGTLLANLRIFERWGYFRPAKYDDKPWKKVLYHLWTFAFTLFQFVGLILIQIYAMVIYWPQVNTIIGAAYIFAANFTHAVKLLNVLFHRGLFKELLEYFVLTLSKEDLTNKEVLNIIIRNEKRAFRDVLAIVACTVMAVISLMLVGDRQDPSGLPLVAKYPFSIDYWPVFATLYLHQMVAVLLAAYFNVTLDMFTTNMCIQVCCQLELLKRDIRLIQEISGDNQDEVSRLLNCVVDRHTLLNSKSQKLGATIGMSVLGQFLGSIFIICITFYHFYRASESNFVSLLGTLTTILWALMQAYFYCYYGNEMKLESESVVMALVELPWYEFSQANKQKIAFIMHQSQRPMVLLAGSLFNISLDTLTSIIKTAYSFFSVMVNFDAKA